MKEIFKNKLLTLLDEKFGKFILVGIVNTMVGTALMFGLYNIVGASYWISSAVNYILTSVLSFFLNKHFTFQNKDPSFLVVVRFSLNILICYFIAYGLAKPIAMFLLASYTITIQENVAMLVGMVFFTILNYLGQRLFAFKED